MGSVLPIWHPPYRAECKQKYYTYKSIYALLGFIGT